MSGRGGRDRFRRDYPSRYDDKGSGGATGRGHSNSNSKSNNPPSRHLWVGNLSHGIVEDELAYHFLKFGPLESIACQRGRSYAFVNFKRDEDAIDAIRTLDGFTLAGNPLRIEFAKADKASTTSRDEHYSRDERSSSLRGSPFDQREFRGRHASPEPYHSDKSKPSDKNGEPSEVLWIGFPAQMKVDELTLKKAFSPFGEIAKITTFPGRSYAFVRFRSLMSACRARDTLKGKLFGNPRVHICFAKSEAGSSSSGRSSFNAPNSPIYNPAGREGSYENLRQDGNNFHRDHNRGSPNNFPNWDTRDFDAYDFNKRGSSWAGGTNSYEQRNFGESKEFYEHRNSPSRERPFHVGDMPQRFHQKGPFFEDIHALPDDVHYLREAKKLKTSSPPERELPEYPFSELERQKRVFPRLLSEFPHHHESFDKSIDAGNFAYNRQTLDRPPNSPMARFDRREGWNPYDSFQMGPGPLQQPNFVEKRRFTPEPDDSSASEWKWEGTIAKGGTPVCRARCFPVGKVVDIMLPEFLDCTARTGLDMLSKHYYQAIGVWVVFFVPGSDADIDFYNEFMRYLEEKQRAAVAKLDDKTTLFLVPPSDFSEKVLKVPGKLSISGVILRLENPGLNNQGPVHIQRETQNEKLLPYHENTTLYPQPSFPSARIPNSPTVSELVNSGISNIPFRGNQFGPAPSVSDSSRPVYNMPESHDERSRDYPPIQQQNPTPGPNWSSHNLHNSFSNRSLPLPPSSGAEEHHPLHPRALQDLNSIQHNSGISGIPLHGNNNLSHLDPLSIPVGALQPEQLAQLAASLMGQQRQPGSSLSAPASEDPRQQPNRVNGPDSSRSSQKHAIENNLVNPEISTNQFGQVLHQMSNVPQLPQIGQRESPRGVNGNQQLTDSSSLPEDAEADPQKRLQATLQLAAVLLQQIQQGKGS